MARLRNKRKLAAVTGETQEENPRNGQSRNTSVPRINEEYITQVFEEIEGRVTKKLSQEFIRTESRILDTLSKLDEFLLNQQIRTHFGTVPGTFRNTNVEKQGTNEDESQSDPHPEVGPSVCQSRHSIDSDTGEAHDMMTGVIEQTTKGPHLVTGATRETRYDPHMVTGATAVQEEVPYCSSGIPSGKQKRHAPQVSQIFIVRTPLRQLKQTRFCWPSSNWRRTVILPMSITTVTDSRNCLNPSRQQCPPSTGNQRNLNCLKIYSKRV